MLLEYMKYYEREHEISLNLCTSFKGYISSVVPKNAENLSCLVFRQIGDPATLKELSRRLTLWKFFSVKFLQLLLNALVGLSTFLNFRIELVL